MHVSAPYLLAWLRAFVLTSIIEVPIYRRGLDVGIGPAFGASALTHPILWFAFVPFARSRGLEYGTYAAIGEASVFLVEAAYFSILFKKPAKQALLWSLVANGASFAFGLIVYALFGRI